MSPHWRWLLVRALIIWPLLCARSVPAQNRPPAARAVKPSPVKPPSALGAPTTAKQATTLVIETADRTPDGQLNLTLDLHTDDGLPPLIELQIDGRVVPTPPPTQLRGVTRPNLLLLHFPLPKSQCELLVRVRSQSGATAQEVRPIGALKDQHTAPVLPDLYVLAVGVGQYPPDSKTTKLKYPAKDAQDLVDTLTGQRETVYRRVVPPRLRQEKDATRQQILEDLAWLEQNVRAIDTTIVFFAGHGININDADKQTYYFLPYDTRTEDRSTMLSGAELHAALAKLRGNVLLLLDTCHAGAVAGSSDLSPFIDKLKRSGKISVLAASQGIESSQESDEWNNGAFTKALVEGLRGRADDKGEHQLYRLDLQNWVDTRVGNLTHNEQHLTISDLQETTNYVVAATPKAHGLLPPRELWRRKLLGGLLGGGLGVALLIGVLAARPWELNNRSTTDLVFF